ncbi:sodium:alanine symporter family protein [uncultured Oscillibacter sp.]|uniref:alanine/glycine:cation symporter family protein n=1 Tax=uncultured Oscillibacter sp. TaxID=876091 RepID=UPI0025F70543|nr:alanine/glycine:cation symporter family protein [uncultured Oscillibacter sp.]
MIVAFLDGLDSFLYYPVLIVVLLAAGLFFSVRTGFVQLRLFPESIRVVMEKPSSEGKISSFQALMVSTASRVGTGNIVGVSTAVCLGGYGAVFWMWLIAIIGGASAFVESTLAQVYKRRDENGDSYGGPAYYIETALHNRGLAVLFSVCLILTYAGGFNMLASYNLQSTFSVYGFYDAKTSPWVIGIILAILVGWCILGGGRRVVKATSAIVPFMGLMYIGVSLVVLISNASLIPAVFKEIFRDAFDFKAIFSGIAGSCMMYGIKRGLYSNEAGVGSAPNAAAAADVSHPVKQGLVQVLSVFIDTILICSATALMCLCSGVEPTAELAGAPYVQESVKTIMGNFGPVFVTTAMVLFAFTTLLGNLFYVDNALTFIHRKVPSKRFMLGFRLACAAIIVIGAALSMSAAWAIADIMMAIMCLINLPACVVLSKVAVRACRDYMSQKKEGINPVFHAADIGMDVSQLDYWK